MIYERALQKRRYSVLLYATNVKIILICNAFYRQGYKSTFNNTKFNRYKDKYLSQDLTSILHNTLNVSCGRETGGWGGGLHDRLRAEGMNQPLCCHLVTAPQQTRDVERMLA